MPKSLKKTQTLNDIKKIKKYFYYFLHIFFLSGILYAFNHFIKTPKNTMMMVRRLWAYESWIILSFYSLFLFLTFMEKEISFKKGNKAKLYLKKFQEILSVNLILLIFPWGLFLILAPTELMSIIKLQSVYWKILGFFSILGAAIYYYPYRFFKQKLSHYIIIFGAIDNLLAGLIITSLFFQNKIPLFAFSSAPLLFYFSHFFFEQSKNYKNIKQNLSE